ncbi:unnamed protein product [Amoebophrya sp. A120]|nr:unnamed protein product [Amoebophrya sp. A120]|eukprot:GSA120T00007661001.1
MYQQTAHHDDEHARENRPGWIIVTVTRLLLQLAACAVQYAVIHLLFLSKAGQDVQKNKMDRFFYYGTAVAVWVTAPIVCLIAHNAHQIRCCFLLKLLTAMMAALAVAYETEWLGTCLKDAINTERMKAAIVAKHKLEDAGASVFNATRPFEIFTIILEILTIIQITVAANCGYRDKIHDLRKHDGYKGVYVSGAQPKHGFNPILYYGGNENLDEFSDSDDEYEEDEPQEVKILINKNTIAKKNLSQHQGAPARVELLAQHQNIHSEDVVDPADHALKTCSTGGMPIARAAPKKTVSFARRIASWSKVRPDEEVDPALLVSPEL